MKTLLAALSLLLLPVCCMAQTDTPHPVQLLVAICGSDAFSIVLAILVLIGVAVFAATQNVHLLLSVFAFAIFARVFVPFMAEMSDPGGVPQVYTEQVSLDEPAAGLDFNKTVIEVTKEGQPLVIAAQPSAPVVTPVASVPIRTFELPAENTVKSPAIGTVILEILGVLAAAVAVVVGGGFAWSYRKSRALYTATLPPTGFIAPKLRRPQTVVTGTQTGFTPARRP